MADIVFPNFGNALTSGLQARALMDHNAQTQRRNALGPDVSAAIGGDNAALGRVASVDPDYALKIGPILDRLDANKQAVLKRAADFTTTMGMGLLNSPPEHRPAAYQAALAEMRRQFGVDTSKWPTEWGPEAEGRIHFEVNKAIPVAKWYEETEKNKREGLTPMTAPGASPTMATGGGGVARTGQLESGGRYDAVNPTSGAFGKFQFMKDTWATVAQARPDLGLPFDPRQATPQQQEAAKGALDQLNGQGLQAAGIPVHDGSLYTAHRFGVKGAQTFWSAPDNAPLASIFPPSWIQQNPDLQNKTVGQFKQFVAQNFGGGPQPTMGTPPASLVAQGNGVAQMPSVTPQQVGARPGTPAQMPNGQGMIPPQGDSVPRATGPGDASGNPVQPQSPQASAQAEIKLLHQYVPPGWQMLGHGVGDAATPAYDKQGRLMIFNPQTKQKSSTAIPKNDQPKTLEERDRETILRGDPSTPDYAAAYAHVGAEKVIIDQATNQITRTRPDMSWARKPTFAGAGVPQPATPPTTGAKEVTVEPGRGKALDNSARDDLTKIAAPALEMTELLKSFDPSFGGYTFSQLGDSANFAKRNLPDAFGGKDEKGQAQWWQRYNDFANLKRNQLFGSALTATEKAAFEAANVNSGMKPEQIAANLQRQQEIATKALSRIANSLAASGYNKEAIEAQIGARLGDLPSPIGGVPQAPPPQKASPSEQGRTQFDAKKAPDGATATGPNGAKMIKRNGSWEPLQ